jgi:C-terminal processing protease CtpA/Prc
LGRRFNSHFDRVFYLDTTLVVKSLTSTPIRQRFKGPIGRWLCLWFLLLFSSCFAAAGAELWETREGRERVFNAFVNVFQDHYWDEDFLDWSVWASGYREAALSAGSRADFDGVFESMIGDLDDDHSSWLGLIRPIEQTPAQHPPGPGLGITFGFLPRMGLVIERVYPHSPAETAGLHRGDVIVQVGDHKLQQAVSSYQATEPLFQAVRTGQVILTIQRRQERLVTTVTPQRLDLFQVAALPQAEMLDARVGYLYIPSFEPVGLASEVHRLVRELELSGAKSIVLDLRGNLGGRLGELGLVLGAFIEGPWAQAFSRGSVVWRGRYYRDAELGQNVLEEPDGGMLRVDDLTDPVSFDGSLVVMVNRTNSSAGEIAALVLQDLGRAVVIGEATAGNVEAIRNFNLPDGSQVLVAVANLQAVSGTSFGMGVVPDVEAVEDLVGLARGYDAPLSEALRFLHQLPFTPNRFF